MTNQADLNKPRPPVCMQCRHQTIRFGAPDPQCLHPEIATFDPVYGSVPRSCRLMRTAPDSPCGPEGRLFEPLERRGWL